MSKNYYNNAVIGNSSMLGCISDNGELIRLYWPNIDYPQHLEKMTSGIFFHGERNSTIWLEKDFEHYQKYIPDTNILETVCDCREKEIKVVQLDYVLPEEDVLVRQYEIENTGSEKISPGFIIYSSAVSTTHHLSSTLFDFGNDAIVHYRHGYYLSICADKETFQFQLGNNAYDRAAYTELNGYDNIGMMKDGAVSWLLGDLKEGEKRRINLFLCFSRTLKGVKALARRMKGMHSAEIFQAAGEYWEKFVKSAAYIDNAQLRILCNRIQRAQC